ncbi:MAG: TetR/AcrR family transcriptional regulator [Candidatus Dormibacteria bacterium]
MRTRQELVEAARELFGRDGYTGASTEQIAGAAGMTKGALYHVFADKKDLFRAVFDEVQKEVSDLVVAKFLLPDSWEALVAGCNLWIDAYQDPSRRQIVLRDGRAVLGWEVVREIDSRFGAVGLRGALRKAMTSGVIARLPLRPLALMLAGALGEACLYVADADDPGLARTEVGDLVIGLLSGLRNPAQGSSDRLAVAPPRHRGRTEEERA